jgi:hypothetical protein
MKKIIFPFLILFGSLQRTAACDICGCGAGGTYIGILPDFAKKILGLRYRYNHLQSHIGVNGSATYLTTAETYRVAEIWSGWNIGKKFRVMGSLPFNFNERLNQGVRKSKNGPGDISLAGFYQLLNQRTMVGKDKLLVQSLWIGAGLKLPTGSYSATDKSNAANNANLFQLGTGSTDASFHLMYDIRLQDAGFNLSSNYKVNTVNSSGYQYGNKFTTSAQAYYKFKSRKGFSVAPNAGILFERAGVDRDKNLTVDISGGRLAMGTAGIETGFNKMVLGANFQTPLSQEMARGSVKAGNRVMIHLSLLF